MAWRREVRGGAGAWGAARAGWWRARGVAARGAGWWWERRGGRMRAVVAGRTWAVAGSAGAGAGAALGPGPGRA